MARGNEAKTEVMEKIIECFGASRCFIYDKKYADHASFMAEATAYSGDLVASVCGEISEIEAAKISSELGNCKAYRLL